MAEQKRILKFAFVADIASAIRSMAGLERQIQETGNTAEQAQRPLVGLPEKTEEAAKAASLAMKRLGLTQESEARARVASLENDVKVIQEAHKRGLATIKDVERAREKLGEQSRRWARLTGADITSSLETPLERLERRMGAFSGRLQSMGERILPFSAAAAGILAGGTLAVRGQMERAFNLETATRAAGMDPTNEDDLRRFQEFAFAAQAALGFQADKTGDVLKDVNDKFGDFIETGAGPLVDFFEKVAPKIGLVDPEKLASFGDNQDARLQYMQQAAQEFVDGKDSLTLMTEYVAALQQAGLGQQEIAFYMEAIASDSVLYYGILKDSAAELRRLSEAASETGGIMSTEDLETMKRAREQIELVKLSLAGLVLKMEEAGLVDAMIRFIEQLKEVAVWIGENINPDLLVWGVAILAALAYLGPVLLALSNMAKILTPIVTGLSKIAQWMSVGANWANTWAKIAVFAGRVWAFMKLIGTLMGIVVSGIGAVPLAIAAALAAIVWVFRDEIAMVFTRIFEGIWEGLKMIGGWLSSAWEWAFGGDEQPAPPDSAQGVPGFSEGGYTGNAPTDAVAGVVHGQEFVVNARATRRYGVDFLNTLNDLAMPPTFGVIPPAMSDAGTPARGAPISFDALVGKEAFPVSTDADTYDRLAAAVTARQASQTMRSPAFARSPS